MEIIKQINNDNAIVDNIEQQYNYYFVGTGTAFIPLNKTREGKNYGKIRDFLYYPKRYVEEILSVLETDHVILIEGAQGSGKSILSFKIADIMGKREQIVPYYLNPPSDWNLIKQWIQSIRMQNRVAGNNCSFLWIIDNLHKIMNAMEDFPDSFLWENDYCICCSRNMKETYVLSNQFLDIGLKEKQIFKREIDENMFFCCVRSCFPTININRKKADYLFHYFGGNLAVLGYSDIEGLKQILENELYEEKSIFFHNIYQRYFVLGKTNKLKINFNNVTEILKMLFLSQLDLSIPFNLQHPICDNVLREYYEVNRKNELDFTHASLAELLTTCICVENHLDYVNYFFSSIRWTVSNMFNLVLTMDEKIKQINNFLRALYSYQFILQINQAINLQDFLVKDEILIDFIEQNKIIISCSTWKVILQVISMNSKLYQMFCTHIASPEFTYSLIYCCDFDFRFIQKILVLHDVFKMENKLLLNSELIKDNIIKKQNEVQLMLLLCSLSEESAYLFLERITSQELVELLEKNESGLYYYAFYLERLSESIQVLLDSKLSVDDYRKICINSASITGFSFLLSENTKEKLKYLIDDPSFIKILVHNTITRKLPLGGLNLSLRKLKIKFPKELIMFEKAIGEEGYLALLDGYGTFPILLDIIRQSSREMQQRLLEVILERQEIVQGLVERTLQNGVSIDTINLSLRQLKKESPDILELFEDAIGTDSYLVIFQNFASIPVFLGILINSSAKMQEGLLQKLVDNYELINEMVERTIRNDASIGTLNLLLRRLKKESPKILRQFEKAVGAERYLILIEALGTIPILSHIIQHSSIDMRDEILYRLKEHAEGISELIERTIQNKDSLGAFDLSLRELKKESPDALVLFEKAVGIEGYMTLIKEFGTIRILGGIIQHSSKDMQKKLLDELVNKPDVIKELQKRTFQSDESIGTFDLVLRKLRWEFPDALNFFEYTMGAEGYLALIEKKGSIPILARFIQHSSIDMQNKLVDKLLEKPEIIEILLNKTVQNGSSIGTFNMSLREIGYNNYFCLARFEELITGEGYLEMFKKCNAHAITILRIMACSCLSDYLVEIISSKMDIWNKAKEQIQEDSCELLKDFYKDLNRASMRKRKNFFKFLRDKTIDVEWVEWFCKGATLGEFILIMEKMPYTLATKIAALVVDDFDKVLMNMRFVEQNRKNALCIDQGKMKHAIKKIYSYNPNLHKIIEMQELV